MTKNIRVESDGYVWEFPASLVASNMANYYASKEASEDRTAVYTQEFENAMKNNFELIDWFEGNMDWKDVAQSATLVKSPIARTSPDVYDSVKVVNGQ